MGNEPTVSIVIAFLNEAARLPGTMDRIDAFLRTQHISHEFVLVNDGSTDNTKEYIDKRKEAGMPIVYREHFPNRGRGVSIRKGVLTAQGTYILETDADGSTALESIVAFLDYFDSNPDTDVIIGSRMMKGARVVTPQPFLRVFLGYGFLYLAKILWLMPRITDFTLGFKMFRKEAARDIFTHQYDNHFTAEAEIVFSAYRLKYTIAQLPVVWSDNRDSRVRPLRDSFRSFKGMIKVMIRALQGKYSSKQKKR